MPMPFNYMLVWKQRRSAIQQLAGATAEQVCSQLLGRESLQCMQ